MHERRHLYFVLRNQNHLLSGRRWLNAIRVLAVTLVTLGKPPYISTLAFVSICKYLINLISMIAKMAPRDFTVNELLFFVQNKFGCNLFEALQGFW